jgi:triacylglycerol esterase/lipase EstA (alpha/beta hydrolase family)
MLAKLLQAFILGQVLLGAGMGYLLWRYGFAPQWIMALLAVGLPFLTLVLLDVSTAILSRSDEPLPIWVRSVVGEIQAGFTTFLFRQPWSANPPRLLPATGTSRKVPVVLVHGYMCNHRIWDDVATTLRANGHAVYAVNLEPLFASIDQYAPIVEEAVEALCRHTDGDQVALVGHSMGGLAIRAWMRAHGVQRAARVITLGTPHAGTQVARHTRTPNGQQMGWQSQWLADLARSESTEVRALKRIAITAQDNIVYPQRAQVLPEVTPTVFEGIGHVQMCLHPPVIQWLADQLGDVAATPNKK